MPIEVDINVTGPMFSGRRADEAAMWMLRDAVHVVSNAAQVRAVQFMRASFKHPTPYYWTRVTTAHPGELTDRVWDQGVVYGPWLEGVGSRNKTSRFEGYWMWRRAFQEIDAKAQHLTAGVVVQYLRRVTS